MLKNIPLAIFASWTLSTGQIDRWYIFDLSNNNITIFNFSKNTNETVEVKDGNKLVIDLSRATDEEKKLVKNILDSRVQSENEAFLMDHSSEKTLKIKQNLPSGESEEVLKFYKDKLKPEMYKALEASLVVKNAFEREEDISEMKNDISEKYPTFGNNLCNLVTRGYFNEHFKELHQSILKCVRIRTFKAHFVYTKIHYNIRFLWIFSIC